MADKLEQSSDARSMRSTQEKEEQDALATPGGPTAETEYPPLKTVLAIIAGMMCVSLLVALVSTTTNI